MEVFGIISLLPYEGELSLFNKCRFVKRVVDKINKQHLERQTGGS